jgi:hypothetical protein
VKGKATLWRPSQENNIATRVVDVNGEFASCLHGKGELFVYGFYFPIVMELNLGGKASICVKVVKYLGKENPLLPGIHNGYKVAYNKKEDLYVRAVDYKYKNYNNCIREKYLSLISEPCLDNESDLIRTSRLLKASSTEQVLFINVEKTNANYASQDVDYGCVLPLTLYYQPDTELPIVYTKNENVLLTVSPGLTFISVNIAIKVSHSRLCTTPPILQIWNSTTMRQYVDVAGDKTVLAYTSRLQFDDADIYEYISAFTVILDTSIQPIIMFVNASSGSDSTFGVQPGAQITLIQFS